MPHSLNESDIIFSYFALESNFGKFPRSKFVSKSIYDA